MRKILFRGKTIDTKEWIDGSYIYAHKWNWDGSAGHLICDIYGTTKMQVIPETVGQFTGLTDKNGKKIFEGDIVKTKYGRLCVVEWRLTQCFCGVDLMVCNCDFNSITKPPSGWDLYLSENLEVIGNIHDNKLEDFENGC